MMIFQHRLPNVGPWICELSCVNSIIYGRQILTASPRPYPLHCLKHANFSQEYISAFLLLIPHPVPRAKGNRIHVT